MLNREALVIPEGACPEQTYTLSKRIAAIELVSTGDQLGRLGPIIQLPPGAELGLCGNGYNDRTVKVRWNGGFYFVFYEDLKDCQRVF